MFRGESKLKTKHILVKLIYKLTHIYKVKYNNGFSHNIFNYKLIVIIRSKLQAEVELLNDISVNCTAQIFLKYIILSNPFRLRMDAFCGLK